MRRTVLLAVLALVATFGWSGTSLARSSTPVLPRVIGAFGQTPKISYPSKTAPSTFEEKVLQQGKGRTVEKGQLIVVNYVGEIWDGKTFDSSFAASTPTPFPIGVGQVISGWDTGLVGQKVGSRVLLVLPPADAYGKTGNSQAGIKATDTLAFVIDIIAAFGGKIGGSANAKIVATSDDGVSVAGVSGSVPKITVAKTARKPTKVITKLLDRGTGVKIKPGLVIVQILATDWTDKVLDSTWQTGVPDGEVVGVKATPNALDPVVGLPLGSRVLLLLPKNANGGPYALAVDLAAQVHGTSSQLK